MQLDLEELVKGKTAIFDQKEKLNITEIGDGNINYVYRIESEVTQRSLIVKQAANHIRTSGNALHAQRIRIEYGLLEQYASLGLDIAPTLYYFDEEHKLIMMEDLKVYDSLREGLLKGNCYPAFPKQIVPFLVHSLLGSSDLIMEAKAKKQLVGQYLNPELCDLSERLVFSDPYQPSTHYAVASDNEVLFRKLLCKDAELRARVLQLKLLFKTSAQSLIHGDLHTGSIFVTTASTKILDPEFGFYGPASYDLGNLIAHLFFARIRYGVLKNRPDMEEWLSSSIVSIIDGFEKEATNYLLAYGKEPLMADAQSIAAYLQQLLHETAGMAGLELIRRVVGVDKVKDITALPTKEACTLAQRRCVLLGIRLLKLTAIPMDGNAYLQAYQEALHQEQEVI